MPVPSASKLVSALLVYLLGTWAIDRSMGGAWSGLTVIGVALLLFGVWYSTVRGARDWGDAAVTVAVALVVGQGLVIMLAQAGSVAWRGSQLIGMGHLAGLGLLAVAWIPLKSQGLLPGGPARD